MIVEVEGLAVVAVGGEELCEEDARGDSKAGVLLEGEGAADDWYQPRCTPRLTTSPFRMPSGHAK